MKICQDNDWAYIEVLKDKSLKVLRQDIADVENKHRHSCECDGIEAKGARHVHQKYEWMTDTLTHGGHTVYWLSCTETISHLDKNRKVVSVEEPTRFVNLTSIKVDKDNVRTITDTGRMRWKIAGYSASPLFSEAGLMTEVKNIKRCCGNDLTNQHIPSCEAKNYKQFPPGFCG